MHVGGDWVTSNLVAGLENYGANGTRGDGDDSINFGDANDHVIANLTNSIAAIASIAIGGQVVGTPGGSDRFGFVAHRIGSFKAAGFTAALIATTDPPIALSIATGDVTIHEV